MMHGKIILSGEINCYKKELSRVSYLNKKSIKSIDKRIAAQRDILFMPISIYDDVPLQDGKYSKSVYKIIIFGVFEDGRRACVVLNDIIPFVEIKVPDGISADSYADKLTAELDGIDKEVFEKATGKRTVDYFKLEMRASATTLTTGKYFKIFQENKSTYVRLHFYKSQDRKYAIEYLQKVYPAAQLVHDDLNNYYRITCRDYLISFNTWIVLSEYVQIFDNDRLKGIILGVAIDNYIPYVDAPPDATTTSTTISIAPGQLQKDPTMSMCWDIETYKSFDPLDKEPPMPTNREHILFMIGVTFQWYHSPDQLLRICFVNMSDACATQSEPLPNYLTVACADEAAVITAFVKVWSWMLPDIILGFNDGMYDWPWLKIRAHQLGLLKFMAKSICQIYPSEYGGNPWVDEKIASRYYRSTPYKIDADTSVTLYKLAFPGYVAIDVRMVFRQLYPNDEASSLNHYLMRLGIPTKLDVNFKDMFDMFEEIQKKEQNNKSVPRPLTDLMQKVAHYCVVDSQRCHEMMHKLYVIMDKRAVSHMSYVSFQDAIERANGMKVRNLIIAAGQQAPFNLKFSNNAVELVGEKNKYPGAYVFPPRKGLVNGKLSIVERRTANHCGWNEIPASVVEGSNVVSIDAIYKIIDQYGATISPHALSQIERTHKITLPQCVQEFLTEEILRPITGLDFNSLYPSLMMAYNLSTEYMILDKAAARDYAKRHDLFPIKFSFGGDIVRGWAVRHDGKTNPAAPDFKFGIFGYVLKQLFDKRKLIKGQMGKWGNIVEELTDKNEIDTATFADARFQYEYLNSMQKALKVFMNTFYGEIGNQRSPFFMVQVAGGITVNGGRCIQLAEKFVREKGCKVYYGDSVAGDSPLILQDLHGNTIIRTIDNVCADGDWIEYPQFKANQSDRIEKQQAHTNYKIWVDHGWKEIRRVIRHKTNKKMFRISTHTGCVDVTEDHSLIRADMTEIKPTNCKIGDELHHAFPTEFNYKTKNELSEHIIANDIVGATPDLLINSDINTRIRYLRSRWITRCGKTLLYASDKLDAQICYYLMKSIGYKIIYISHCDGVYCLYMAQQFSLESATAIKKILELPSTTQEEFVYDIETECGRFMSGIGELHLKNTDSIFESMPDLHFVDVDRAYFTNRISKEEYWFQLVDITLMVAEQVRNEINQFFFEDNGTEYLKMAFEEALYPALLTGKKKYVGIAHEKKPSFTQPLDIPAIREKIHAKIIASQQHERDAEAANATSSPPATRNDMTVRNAVDDGIIAVRKKQFFMRGLDIVRRGMPNFAKEIVLDILEKILSTTNTQTVFDIVKDKIHDIYQHDWNSPDKFYKFIMTDQYKPHKKNEKLHVFARRMAQDYNVIVKPFERFRYIIARKYPYRYDICGRKVALKGGEKMELADIAFEKKIPIDVDCYMSSKLNGQLARLVAYHTNFIPNIVEVDNFTTDINATIADPDTLAAIEVATYKNAVKWVETYSANFNSKYVSTGNIYKKISGEVSKLARNTIGDMTQMHLNNKLLVPKSENEVKGICDWILKKTDAAAKLATKKYGEKYVDTFVANYTEANGITKEFLPKNKLGKQYGSAKECARVKLFDMYCGSLNGVRNYHAKNMAALAEEIYDKKNKELHGRLFQNAGKIRDLLNSYNNIVLKTSNYVAEQTSVKSFHVPNANANHIEDMVISVADYIENYHDQLYDKVSTLLENRSDQMTIGDMAAAVTIYEDIYREIVSNNVYIYEIRSVIEQLQKIKNKVLGNHAAIITDTDIEKMVDDVCGANNTSP